MAKTKSTYVCSSCGYETPQWYGKCPSCSQWNTLIETMETTQPAQPKPQKQRGGTGGGVQHISQIDAGIQMHTRTGIAEFDRVIGGGIVEGSLLLVGGEPGVGKSTLLLQVCSKLSQGGKRVLYISGEESSRQIKLRATRVGAAFSELLILAENAMDAIEDKLTQISPDYIVVDSIQTMYRPELSGAPGSVSQVRESAALFMRYAKTTGCSVILVGHVTKDGAIAGPRVLEHMVDVVLYFEGDYQHEFRLLRAVKNRFGSVNELGVFEMTGQGMLAVENASEILLSRRAKDASGSVVFCGMEGSRPMLVDLQALVTQSFYTVPKRTVNGMDQGRVSLLLAVLEKRAGLRLYNQDVYINVAGGMTLSEPATDLAVCIAVASSLADKVMHQNWAVMGEVGLAGEIRAISQIDRRIAECGRMGFMHIICPTENTKKLQTPPGIILYPVDSVSQAVARLHNAKL